MGVMAGILSLVVVWGELRGEDGGGDGKGGLVGRGEGLRVVHGGRCSCQALQLCAGASVKVLHAATVLLLLTPAREHL